MNGADKSLDHESKKDESNDFIVVSNDEKTMIAKLIQAMRNLETTYNPDATKIIEEVIEKEDDFKLGRMWKL